MSENAENDVYVARIGINTLNKVKVPLIFIPGVMGSRLSFTASDQKWNPDRKRDMVHWIFVSADKERLQLHYLAPATVMTDSPDNDLDKDEKNRGWEGVAWKYYGDFLRALNKERFGLAETPVYAVGYDWRQGNKDAGAYIASHIDRILQQEEAQHCILFTHSMGGLAARAALQVAPDLKGKALGVIHVFQPVAGAAVAYRRFLTGATRHDDGF